MALVGSRLMELRQAHGMSRRNLAAAARIPASSLAAMELGRRRPTASAVIKISDALGLTQSERLELLELIGHPVYPGRSFFAGHAQSLLERTLLDVLEHHRISPQKLASELGMSNDELESELGSLLPGERVLSTTIDRLRLAGHEADRLKTVWSMQAAALVPWDAPADEQAGSPTALVLSLLGGRHVDHQQLSYDAREILERFARTLAMENSDLASMLDVTEAEVESWRSRDSLIPLFVIARTKAFAYGLEVLARLFAADRLPDVVRRPAALFDGRAAIDLIRQGDVESVAEKYDHALQFSA
jgi:transcriptional regulator with XRE-family HTH domain